MTTRFNAKPKSRFGVPPLNGGYNNLSTSTELTIPSVGIEDVDVALFELFDKEIKFTIIDSEGLKPVPTLFASGEKWAMIKKGKAIRDRHGSLRLPLITIGRTNIQQVSNEDQAGRGINQQTGEIVIKRRLAAEDRSYQSLLNNFLISNQDNLAHDENVTLNNNRTPILSDEPTLAPNLKNNVWEFITIPSPQFFTANYDVIIWTTYTQHMNQILELLLSSFLPQGNSWKLETKKGYWFIADVDSNMYSGENNFDNMSTEERIIKYKFSIKVRGYILASNTPGAPVPIKRFISAPDISFNVLESNALSGDITDPFLGADDPTLPTSIKQNDRNDQRETFRTKLYPKTREISPDDPALTTLRRGQSLPKYKEISGIDKHGNKIKKLLRVKSLNKHTGEMTFDSTFDLSEFSVIFND